MKSVKSGNKSQRIIIIVAYIKLTAADGPKRPCRYTIDLWCVGLCGVTAAMVYGGELYLHNHRHAQVNVGRDRVPNALMAALLLGAGQRKGASCESSFGSFRHSHESLIITRPSVPAEM